MAEQTWGSSPTPAGWYDDPSMQHEYRYFDGSTWTSHVANQGRTSSHDADSTYPPPTPDMRPPGPAGQTGNGKVSDQHAIALPPASAPRSMGFTDAIQVCLSKYVDVRGRASRSEYWWFALFAFLAMFAASLVGLMMGGEPMAETAISIVFFVLFLPNLTVTVRRLHDIGITGWAVLVGLIPVLGVIALFILMLVRSHPGSNRYGPGPAHT